MIFATTMASLVQEGIGFRLLGGVVLGYTNEVVPKLGDW